MDWSKRIDGVENMSKNRHLEARRLTRECCGRYTKTTEDTLRRDNCLIEGGAWEKTAAQVNNLTLTISLLSMSASRRPGIWYHSTVAQKPGLSLCHFLVLISRDVSLSMRRGRGKSERSFQVSLCLTRPDTHYIGSQVEEVGMCLKAIKTAMTL